MGIVCGQKLKFKSQEFYASRILAQSIKQQQEDIEYDDQDQLFCPSLTKNYILNPKFLYTHKSKLESEVQHQITQIEQNSSQLSLGIQNVNNPIEIQVKKKKQNKLKPDSEKRMSLQQRFKIALSPSQCRKRNSNTSNSPLSQILQNQNHSSKQKERLILTKGKQKTSNKH